MSLGTFIKNNLALVAGLAVPVVMVAGFLILSQAGKMFTDPPRHIAYFVGEDRTGATISQGVELRMDANGSIVADVTQYSDNSPAYRRKPLLIAYDAAKGTIKELPLQLPPDLAAGVYAPPEYAAIRLSDKGNVAPDGYEVAYAGGHSGFVVDIFIRNSASGYRIRKGAASYKLPDRMRASPYYWSYDYARFLGWSAQ